VVTPKARPSRRSPEQLRELITAAATELFTAAGYTGATTKQIAERAGVTEKALFRHFQSKAALFEVSMLAPFIEFIDRYYDSWRRFPPELPPEQRLAPFIRGFFPLVRAHRDLLLSLITVRATEGRIGESIADDFAAAIRKLQSVASTEIAGRRWPGSDPAVTIAASAGMVISLVLHEDWLLPNSSRGDDDHLAEQVINLIIHGVAHRDTAPPAESAPLAETDASAL
jgi:AcrR family transcriptional regulator